MKIWIQVIFAIFAAIFLISCQTAGGGGGGNPGCANDDECPPEDDDGLFCTGSPVCLDDGSCELSGSPCEEDETCDEANDECIPAEEPDDDLNDDANDDADDDDDDADDDVNDDANDDVDDDCEIDEEDVCEKVEDINCGIWDEWAYWTLDECYQDLPLDCDNFDDYLDCMCDCIDMDNCVDFEPCEVACCDLNC